MLKDLINQSLPGLEALLAAVGTLLLTYATQWIRAHAKNATVAGILDRLTETVAVVVREAEQTLVAELKKGGDAPLSSDDAKRVLDTVLDSLKTHLGPKGIAEIEKIIDPSKLNQILISYIEAEVNDLRKASGSVSAAPAAAPAAVVS